ncbi:MAG: lysophospholipid acyltransferase family protein [Methylacidiphilales bacterium]|nr:lysophospholipid acyltransferase family protein [Candidatus Methylacidiphilales bacterium]
MTKPFIKGVFYSSLLHSAFYPGQQERFQLRWIFPWYWHWWLFLAIWFAIGNSSRVIKKSAINLFCSLLLTRRNKKSGLVIHKNLSICFPTLTDEARQKIIVDYFSISARVFIDYPNYVFNQHALDHKIQYNQKELLDNALAANKGIILLMSHTSSADLMLAWLLSEIQRPSYVIYRPLKNKFTQWWFNRSRVKHCPLLLIPRGSRIVFQSVQTILKAKGIFGVFLDESIASSRSVTAPFFNYPKPTLVWLSKILKMNDALLLGCYCRYDLEQERYHIDFHRVNLPSAADPLTEATAINTYYEKVIRNAPENFIWQFKIFRNPSGQDPY